jgi:parallel beta-helix repeat protein
MQISESNENTIFHNIITNNVEIGIYLWKNNNNLITDNNLKYNKNTIKESNCFGNIYQNNIMDKNPYSLNFGPPITIGIICLITVYLISVVFSMYEKKVKNKKILDEKRSNTSL